jgi:hypothetical protein
MNGVGMVPVCCSRHGHPARVLPLLISPSVHLAFAVYALSITTMQLIKMIARGTPNQCSASCRFSIPQETGTPPSGTRPLDSLLVPHSLLMAYTHSREVGHEPGVQDRKRDDLSTTQYDGQQERCD